MVLSEGVSIGPYRLVGRAGAGGMAEVWRAYDARLKRYVAIKFLSPRYATDQQYLDRFRHEAPGAAAWIVIGWTLAAVLALLSVSVLLPAMERNLLGDLLSGPRRFGTGAGLVAGLISGLVGGWLTLWALRHASSGGVRA
jgi:serine/threonine protein kinase